MKVFMEPQMQKILLVDASVITESVHTIDPEDGGFWNNSWEQNWVIPSTTRESGWTPNY